MINILITSAGRRVSLLKAFIKASKDFDTKSEVFITDLNPFESSPTSHFAHKSFKIGFFSEANYVDDLLKICLDNSKNSNYCLNLITSIVENCDN